MTEKDVVFKKYAPGEIADPNSFCHYGWEGTGSFAFWRYATAYFDSAEVLFEKFKTSGGDNSLLDGLGMTMCFLYRHFVELYIKHLYVKFDCKSEDDYKGFLAKGHNLHDLWASLKPKLSELRKRVGSAVEIGVLEHYILEFDRFDKDSMSLRYPVKKDLSPMNGATRLDILNLHEKTKALYKAFEEIDSDLEHQLLVELPPEIVDSFFKKYEELRSRVLWFIEEIKSYTENKDKDKAIEHKWMEMSEISPLSMEDDKLHRLFQQCNDDELMMFDTLYYTGRSISSGELRLPKSPRDAQIDAVKMCIINMRRDHLEFGKPKNDQICIYEKSALSIERFLTKVVAVLDWDK